MFKFKMNYFFLFIILFITEVIIALFVRDKFGRPYFGDFLVVIMIYCFLKSFVDFPLFSLAFGVLWFAYFVETLQYFKFIKILGCENSKVAKILIGTSFGWLDIFFYTLGIFVVIFFEIFFNNSKT